MAPLPETEVRVYRPAPAREPEWLRRMREKGLPAKDMTRG